MTKTALRMAAILATLAVSAGPTLGDDVPASLKARLVADEARTDALSHQLAWDGSRAQQIQVADLFGPSDEEKAAAAAAALHEQNQDQSIATLNQRAGDIEDSLRRLTGQIEVLNHRLDEMDQRIDRMKKDFDYKLCTLSAQQLGATTAPGAPSALPCNGDTTGAPAANVAPPAPGNTPPAPAGVTHLAPPPGILGTLPAGSVNAMPSPSPDAAPPQAAPTQLASNDMHAQFESAMNLLAKSQYDAASAAFRTFADTYPKDPDAPAALYWVGDIAYVQKDYTTASHVFADSLKKYPTDRRAPESMLKLGQSLLAMNQKDQGCTALRFLAAKYPTASKTVLSEAAAVRRAGGCRH